MFDFAGVLVLVGLLALFAFLFLRSWGSKRAWLKWVGVVLSGLLTLVFLLGLVLALYGFYKLNAAPGNPVSNLKAGGTPEQIARVGRWATLCAGCHSTTLSLPLDGGKDNFGEDPSGGPSLGTIYPPNLTPGGTIKDWTDGEIIRAIREGVHKTGRPLIIMPAEVFTHMSDEDVQALVAYLRSAPNIQRTTPPTSISTFGAILVATGAPLQTNQPPITKPVTNPPHGATAQYGEYLVSWSGCRVCHGEDLAGGTPGGFAPVGPNLTAIMPKRTEADFFKTIRAGVTAEGKQLDNEQMPWKEYAVVFSDDELKAVFAYLKGLKMIEKPAQ